MEPLAAEKNLFPRRRELDSLTAVPMTVTERPTTVPAARAAGTCGTDESEAPLRRPAGRYPSISTPRGGSFVRERGSHRSSHRLMWYTDLLFGSCGRASLPRRYRNPHLAILRYSLVLTIVLSSPPPTRPACGSSPLPSPSSSFLVVISPANPSVSLPHLIIFINSTFMHYASVSLIFYIRCIYDSINFFFFFGLLPI